MTAPGGPSAPAGGPGAEEPPRPADRLSFLIHRVNARIANTANRILRTHAIDSFGARVLVLLLERDGQRVGALVEALSLPQPTLSHLLARLERRGLVRRRRNAEDNRSVAVVLTPAGRQVAVECESLSAGVQRHMVRGLAPEQVAEMRRILVLMAETLAQYESEAPAAPAARSARSRGPANPARARPAAATRRTSRRRTTEG